MSNLSLVVFCVIGLPIGGLLNVLADYLPRRELPGPPMCASCSKPHRWSRWLAVTGYLLAGGRCAHCGARIRLRHLFTELVTVLLFAFLQQRYTPAPRLFFETIYTAIFVLLFVIDLEHKLILHVTTLPAILLAAVGSFFLGRENYNWRVALVGGATGFLLVLGMYLLGHLFVRTVERRRGQKIGEIAFGFGDVTLTTFIGLVVGFPNVVFALLLGIVLGGIGGAAYWLVKAVIRRDYSPFTAIPYGPFLIAGGWGLMIWGQEFLRWYSGG